VGRAGFSMSGSRPSSPWVSHGHHILVSVSLSPLKRIPAVLDEGLPNNSILPQLPLQWPCFQASHILRYWGLGFQHGTLGDTVQLLAVDKIIVLLELISQKRTDGKHL
jgi:hypothetical protein